MQNFSKQINSVASIVLEKANVDLATLAKEAFASEEKTSRTLLSDAVSDMSRNLNRELRAAIDNLDACQLGIIACANLELELPNAPKTQRIRALTEHFFIYVKDQMRTCEAYPVRASTIKSRLRDLSYCYVGLAIMQKLEARILNEYHRSYKPLRSRENLQ